jgi:hypothetical protein
MKSIDDQIVAMESQWSNFSLKERGKNEALWEGVLAPDKREHVVRISYRAPAIIELFTLRDIQPRVQVIKPMLEQHPDYEEGPIPHVYWSERYPKFPYLCLFSPSGAEWTPDDLLAHTTVFWAAEWLYFYEGWLLTKKWRGGGRHPGRVQGGVKQLEAV